MSSVITRQRIIGVMGSSKCDPSDYETARQMGELLAQADYILLCGGGTGIMEAAAKGASEAGGLTLGIMPGRDAADSPPNQYIQIPVFTALEHARNAINVLTSDLVIAVSGAYGTLSEIALAAASEKDVILLNSWTLTIPDQVDATRIHYVDTPREAIELVKRLLNH